MASAGFGARLGALVIDGIILTLFFVPAVVGLVAGPKETKLCSVDAQGNIEVFDEGAPNAICEGPSGTAWTIFAGLGVAGFLGVLLYHGKLEGGSGQTVGAKATGIAVVDIHTGQPIGPGRAIGRYFARTVSVLPCALGYLWMLWDERNRTWHDKATSSVVVRL